VSPQHINDKNKQKHYYPHIYSNHHFNSQFSRFIWIASRLPVEQSAADILRRMPFPTPTQPSWVSQYQNVSILNFTGVKDDESAGEAITRAKLQ